MINIIGDQPPLITIGICTFNAQETIARALTSALAQSWKNIEILIVDDHSTDNTWGILKKMELNHNVVRIYQNDINGGVAVSRNRIISEARGMFIGFFDDDDESYPERLSRQYLRIVNYENEYALDNVPIVCHSTRKVVYPDGRILVQPTMGTNLKKYAPNGLAVVKRVLLGNKIEDGRGACPTCCQFARRHTYRMIAGFDSRFRRSEDTELVVRLALSGAHFVGLSDPLVVQYMGKASTKSLDEEYIYHKMILEKFSKFLISEGQYFFCKEWLDFKFYWLVKSYWHFFRSGAMLLFKYPIKTIKRCNQARPNLAINNRFRKFHSHE